MSDNGQNKEGQDVFTKGIQKASIWIGFAVTISGIIGSYAVHSYRTSENEKKLIDFEQRLRVLEKTNPDLVLQQLKSIETMNNQMDQKISNTNQRIDEVLKVLINK